MSIERKHDPQGDKVCENCGAPNPIWFTEHEAWNKVGPGGGGILCPRCFIGFYEQLEGVGAFRWRVIPDPLPARTSIHSRNQEDR